MRLPPPVRRRLDQRDERMRAEGEQRMRARRARDRYRYVFVVAYGRSGSTLVQGLLNALPRTLVRGESDFYVLHLYRALSSVREFRREHFHHGTNRTTSAFYGLNQIRRPPFLQAMNDVVTASVIGDEDPTAYDVVGFKEVLWHRLEADEAEEFFTAMDQAFPDARYVLNTRDPDQVVGSGFWRAFGEEEARRTIGRVVAVQDFLRATRPDRVLDVRYEDLVDAARVDATLRRVAEFVTGEPPDPALVGRMRALLDVGHGPGPFGANRDDAQP